MPINNQNGKNMMSSELSLKKRYNAEARFYVRRYGVVTMLSTYEKFKKSKTQKGRLKALLKMRKIWNSMNPIITDYEVFENKNMSNLVFEFYRHKINPEIDSKNHLLHDDAFEFKNLLDGKEPDKKRYMTLITAATQSGKTFLAIALINILLSLYCF